MAQVKWRMKGQWLKKYDFNARPTLGHCQRMVAMKMDDEA